MNSQRKEPVLYDEGSIPAYVVESPHNNKLVAWYPTPGAEEQPSIADFNETEARIRRTLFPIYGKMARRFPIRIEGISARDAQSNPEIMDTRLFQLEE